MAETKQQTNQTEAEFFAVVGTGRKGVEDMLVKMGSEIKAIAAPNVQRDWDTWIKRIFVDVANREELQPVLATRPGIYSLYQEIAKAATAGFQLGGLVPQGYFVPKQGKVVFVDTMAGRAFVATHGPGAVLKREGQLVRVYENDSVITDAVHGDVKHIYDLVKDRGKHVGWYMILEYRDGHIEAPYITADKVRKINDAYSTKETSKNYTMPAWAKSPEEMEDKTAGKQLYKKPFREAVGLAMYRTLESPDDEELPPPPPRLVSERVGSRLDRAVEGMDPKPEGKQQGNRHEGVQTGAQSEGEPQKPPTDQQPAAQEQGPPQRQLEDLF